MTYFGRTASAAVALASVMLAALSAGAVNAQQGGGAPPPPAVTVVTVQPETVTLTSRLPGRVVASAVAEVRPQVSGLINERLFREGGEVREGDILYRIDAATYEAALAQAEAAVAQAEATYINTQREAERVEELKQRNVTSQQVVDSAVAARDAAAAGLQVARAQLQSAQIDLDRTTIRAPLSGDIGLSQTTQGALVTASQAEPLAVIRSIDTVHVDVTQSAADMLAWRRGQTDAALEGASREVKLILADGSTYERTGTLIAAEHNVDEQTGVITLRLDFENPDKLLLPGMYVQVDMPTGTIDDAYMVPQEGVSRDRRGRPVAMVVNADNVVEAKQLEIASDRGNRWIVTGGLEPGARVVVEGLQKASPGATVMPEERAPSDLAAIEGGSTAPVVD
ncbi:efflux RND transporter periplasmic adaptor subunit [Halovulum sp. GXIMD14794]